VIGVLGSMGVLTPADVQAWCAANGSTPADCAAIVATQTVNGVFCDGDVDTSLDASGNKVVTCVPTGAIEAKIAAIKADCLAHCGQTRTPQLTEQCIPYCGGSMPAAAGSVSASSGLLVLGGLAALAAGGVWWLVR
jgi:hypothetical protein